jgi:2'-5' RNA ligase
MYSDKDPLKILAIWGFLCYFGGMPVIRAFIAIQIPAVVHEQLDHISKDLQSQTKNRAIHWVAVQNIHLTLKFLGDISSNNLEHLTKILKGEAEKHSPFEIRVEGIGAFPSIRRPRVIWVGIDVPPQLKALQKGVEAEALRLGYLPEERGFSPHLTLARVSPNASPDEIGKISELVANYKVGHLGTFRVDSIVFFKSDLRPGGAVYTPLSTISLKVDRDPAKV